jgi:hypothetical protein
MSSIVVSFLFDRLQRRLVSLPVAIVFAVAVLALMPMPAQASAGAQSPQSGGTPATYENGGYNGRGIYPTYRRNARKRPGARYQQYGAHRHNAPRNNCCAHYANPSKKHQDQHHDQDGHDYAKGHHDHGAYHNEGHRHGYDAHRKHDHDKHHKHRGSKYGDNFDPYARGG